MFISLSALTRKSVEFVDKNDPEVYSQGVISNKVHGVHSSHKHS